MLLYGVDKDGNPRALRLNDNGSVAMGYDVDRTVVKIASLSNTPQVVKPTAGVIYGFNLINVNTSVVYLKIYDDGAPTVGTTVPKSVIMVPTSGTVLFVAPYAWRRFDTAISVACVTSIADSSTTAPTTGLYCEIDI